MRAVVATHAVYGYGNQRDLDRVTTNEPGAACIVYAFRTTDMTVSAGGGGSRVTPLSCAIGQPKACELLFALGLYDLLAAIETVRADVVPQVRFAGCRFHRQRRISQEIMRAVHAALGRRFLVLLDCHVLLLKFESVYCRFRSANELKGDFFPLSPSPTMGEAHSPG